MGRTLEMKREDYIPVLTNIEKILRQSKNYGQADVIEKLLILLNNEDLTDFKKLANSVDIWGGAGAVWEVNVEDNEFKKNMLDLINLLITDKVLEERTEKSVKPLKKFFTLNSNN